MTNMVVVIKILQCWDQMAVFKTWVFCVFVTMGILFYPLPWMLSLLKPHVFCVFVTIGILFYSLPWMLSLLKPHVFCVFVTIGILFYSLPWMLSLLKPQVFCVFVTMGILFYSLPWMLSLLKPQVLCVFVTMGILFYPLPYECCHYWNLRYYVCYHGYLVLLTSMNVVIIETSGILCVGYHEYLVLLSSIIKTLGVLWSVGYLPCLHWDHHKPVWSLGGVKTLIAPRAKVKKAKHCLVQWIINFIHALLITSVNLIVMGDVPIMLEFCHQVALCCRVVTTAGGNQCMLIGGGCKM